MEKYYTAVQVTDDNKAHAYCMLDNRGYKHTLRNSNEYKQKPHSRQPITSPNIKFGTSIT